LGGEDRGTGQTPSFPYFFLLLSRIPEKDEGRNDFPSCPISKRIQPQFGKRKKGGRGEPPTKISFYLCITLIEKS